MPQQRAELVSLGQCKNIEKPQHLIIIMIPKFNTAKDKRNRKKTHKREVKRVSKQINIGQEGRGRPSQTQGHKNKTHKEEDQII